MRRLITAAFTGTLVATALAAQEASPWVDVLMEAYVQQRRLPAMLSDRYPNLGEQGAYDIQKAYVAKRLAGDKIAGFKAAASAVAQQKAFGLQGPASGILFESGKKTEGDAVNRSTFSQPMVETEIGFLIGQRITEPLKDPAEFQKAVESVMPVIELPDLIFPQGAAIKGVDLVAANTASAQFLVGKQMRGRDTDLDSITVTLSRDGKELAKGSSAEAIGDQWASALWLVNQVLDQGYVLERGQLVISGTMTGLLPADPGSYVADYGDFGRVVFQVR